jgi:hypothetical protein
MRNVVTHQRSTKSKAVQVFFSLVFVLTLILSQYLGFVHGIYHIAENSSIAGSLSKEHAKETTVIKELLNNHFDLDEGEVNLNSDELSGFESKSCNLFNSLMQLSSLVAIAYVLLLLNNHYHFVLNTPACKLFTALLKNYQSRAPPVHSL